MLEENYKKDNNIVRTKVSIIVPVYNSQKYLKRCIVSLLSQTMQEIEIILIDDASTDDSKLILHQYQHQFPEKIRCIYLEENVHQGGARNRGIEIAKGEFIMFVDSDDRIENTICEKLYNKAIESSSDIVFCDILKIYQNKNKQLWFSYVFIQQLGEMTEEKKKLFLFTEGYPVAKIIRTKLVMENYIRYPEKMKYEDLAVGALFYIYAKKTDYIAEPLYFYEIRDNSTSQRKNSVEHYNFIQAAKYLCNSLENTVGTSGFKEEIEAIYTYGILQGIKKILTQFDEPDMNLIFSWCQDLIEKYPDYEKNRYFYYKNEPMGILAMDYAKRSKEDLFSAFQLGKLQEKYANYVPYYNFHKEKIRKLLWHCYEDKMIIAIWGAGKKGSDFLETCDSKCNNISYVIDKDIAKVGNHTRTGHLIQSFDSIINEVDVIFSMNRFYHSGIKEEVKNCNNKIKVVNLDVFLLGDFNEPLEIFFE